MVPFFSLIGIVGCSLGLGFVGYLPLMLVESAREHCLVTRAYLMQVN
jgi:hypothetical protein